MGNPFDDSRISFDGVRVIDGAVTPFDGDIGLPPPTLRFGEIGAILRIFGWGLLGPRV